MTPYPFYINGQKQTSNKAFPVRFSYTGEVIAEVYQPEDAHLEQAVQAAQRGARVMRRMPAHERSAMLRRLHSLMEARTEDLVNALVMEGGKTKKAARAEVARAKQTVWVASEEARRIPGEVVNMDWTKDGENRIGLVKRFPLGVILCIAPFNYPLNLACHKIAPALAAGNSFILKPASATPLSALLLAELLLEAGAPPETVNVITASGAQAEKLVRDERIAMFSFTGSSAVGWHLKSICGRKRATLELGGNAAVIVHEDANQAYAAKRIAFGGFTNAGQNCISVQRVLIHRPIFNDMLETLLDEIKALKVGDPRLEDTDVGPMITESAAAQAESWVEEAVHGGARVLLGGPRHGALLPPTVLTDVRQEMKVSCQEVFAPVLTVSPYDTFEEAIQVANSTDYGLQGGVFTRDITRILKAYDEIEVGGLQVNDVSTFRIDHMPYGGVKGSGIGREGLKYAIEEMTEPKLMVINMNA
ncbi:MAG: aldehyde dehydrogenase family protein [Thermoflexales bacterium]|nr:aldehyde dehydrogenase family protein [Thermoflexales bacterium]